MVAVASALSGRFTARAGGPVPALLIGLGVGAAGLFGLAPATALPGYLPLVPPLVAAGFGMALTMPAATTTVVDGVPDERAGVASGTVNAVRQVGSVLGIGLLGALAPAAGGSHGNLEAAFVIVGAAFIAGIVVTLAVVRRGARDGQERNIG